MAVLAIQGGFEGDFVLNLVPIDDQDSMEVVAEKIAFHSVNRRVARQDRPMRVRYNGEVASPQAKVAEVGIGQMDFVEAFYA